MDRSYLFAPGPQRETARQGVRRRRRRGDPRPRRRGAARRTRPPRATHGRRRLATHPAWVRINAAAHRCAAADLAAVAALAYGIRIPKVESVDDVRWVADRAPGKPLLCAIESAKGVANALAIAAEPGVSISPSAASTCRRTSASPAAARRCTTFARISSSPARAAGHRARRSTASTPILNDTEGLRRQAASAAPSASSANPPSTPRQLPTIHTAFSPREDELHWARGVLRAFDEASGAAIRLPGGEFVDLPVAERARKILQLAASPPA